MEDQPKNLGTLCRVCGKSFDEDDRVTKISTLKIHQKVKTELFGEDEKNTHPDKICHTCKRKIDAIDKNFRDPKLRGKNVFKNEFYKCPMCSKKRKRGIN